jgi:signal transduction histidine kinase
VGRAGDRPSRLELSRAAVTSKDPFRVSSDAPHCAGLSGREGFGKEGLGVGCLALPYARQADSIRELHGAIESVIVERKAEFQNHKGQQETELQRALSNESPLQRNKIELVAHALNNLLCVISAYADILGEQVEGPEPAVRSIGEIKKAAKRASDLMRHLK